MAADWESESPRCRILRDKGGPPLGISSYKKKRPGEEDRAARGARALRLETQLGSDLQGARRGVCAQESSEDAGWGGDGSVDEPELRIGNVAYRLIEVGMVQDVKGLRSDLKFRALPVGESEVLHERQVGVEEIRTIDLVAALVAKTGNTACVDGCGELTAVHAWRSRGEIVEHVGTAAGERSHVGVRENSVAVVEAVQHAGGSAVDYGERQSGAHEECSGKGPVKERVQEEIVKSRGVIEVGEICLFTNVVIGVAIVVSFEVVWILGRKNAGVRGQGKGQESAVGDVVESMAPCE